jgi:cell division protein FtsN
MGIPVWNYFLGDGSLPSMNYLFFSLILFGVILLLIIFNLDQVVKFSNSLSKEENTPTALEENKTEEEIVPSPTVEEKPKVEVKNTPIEKPAPTGDPKPYSPHSGSKRSGVWINEK